MTPASALVVVAHPDDGELACGGTVAKWTAAGAAVTFLVLTDGSKGAHDPDVGDAELRDRREAEQRAAAAVLGLAGVRFLRRVDGELSAEPGVVLEVAAAIRELRPEVLVGHDPWRPYDLHPDHEAAGQVLRRAAVQAREPRAARTLGLAAWRPRELLLMRPHVPDRAEDVTAFFARKLEALLCHESQLATSFGIQVDGDRESFAARLREDARDGDALVERFRGLRL